MYIIFAKKTKLNVDDPMNPTSNPLKYAHICLAISHVKICKDAV